MLRKSQARTGYAIAVVSGNDDGERYQVPEILTLRVHL